MYRKTYTDEHGKRHDVRAKTKKELKEKLKRKPSRGVPTVREWAETCFTEYKDVKPNTLYIQKNCFDTHVNKYIGSRKLTDITPIECQNVINKTKGLSEYTIRRVAQLMKFVFKCAVENGYLDSSPVMVRPPRGGKRERRPLTKHEQELFLNAVERNPRFVFFLVMLLAGLRNSEVAELKGSDLKAIEGKLFLHIRGTKTKNAKRDVPCPHYLAERLPKVGQDEYIFKNCAGKKMKRPDYSKLWKKVRKEMCLIDSVPPETFDDLTSYCLRHTYCTNLYYEDIDVRVAQALLGHSTIALTADIYTHLDNSSILGVWDKIDSAI